MWGVKMYPTKYILSFIVSLSLVIFSSFAFCSPVGDIAIEECKNTLDEQFERSFKATQNSVDLLKKEPAAVEEAIRQDPLVEREGNISRGTEVTCDLDLTELTHYQAVDFDEMLAGTPLNGYGDVFVRIEEEIGVNGLFMAGLCGQEQGFGRGPLAVKKNNLTSYAAYDGQVSKARSFESFEECLLVTANMLRKNYLTEGGKHHNGFTLSAVNVKYATDKKWDDSILVIMKKLKSNLDK